MATRFDMSQTRVDSSCRVPPPKILDCHRLRQDLEAKEDHTDPVPAFLNNLPAADLHIHGGALCETGLATDIAWERSRERDGRLELLFGSKEALAEKLTARAPGSLKDYLFLYHALRDYLFTTLPDIKTVCHAGALNAFRTGTRLLEIRTSIKSGEVGDPASRYLMKEAKFTPYEEFVAMIEGLEYASRATGGRLRFHLIVTFRRGDSIENSLKIFDEVVQLRFKIREHFGKDYIRGLDIAGAEFGEANKGKRFKEIFRRAKEAGFFLTAHAGEEDGVGEGAILHALNHLNVDRIGHGSSLYLPTPLLDKSIIHTKNGVRKNAFIRLLQRGISQEMCLTSNMIAGAQYTKGYMAVPGDKPKPDLKPIMSPADYPFKMLMALGDLVHKDTREVLPLVCTDGTFSLHTNLAREYSIAAKNFDLGLGEVLALAYHSIQKSFAEDTVKDDVIKTEWLPVASRYYDNPVQDVTTCLSRYRQRLRDELELTPIDLTRIADEVCETTLYN